MAYKILFIDEEKSQHDLFQNYMDAAPDDMVVKCLFPESDINAMIAKIDEEHPDAIVADYLLNDMKTDVNYNISYNGVEQIQKDRGSIIDAKSELKGLLEKRVAGSISLQEEQRLIDLDDFLEKSLDSYHAIPKEMKELSNLKNIATLIDKVDDLLKKFN